MSVQNYEMSNQTAICLDKCPCNTVLLFLTLGLHIVKDMMLPIAMHVSPMSTLCVVWIALTHNVEWEGLGTMETTKMVVFMSHYTGLALLVLHKRACV